MDTDDLSKETFKAIFRTAEKFHHDLILQFGLLSYNCNSDDEFLNHSEELVKSWLAENNLQYIVDDIFYENPPSEINFRQVLERILINNSSVKKISPDKRKFESW